MLKVIPQSRSVVDVVLDLGRLTTVDADQGGLSEGTEDEVIENTEEGVKDVTHDLNSLSIEVNDVKETSFFCVIYMYVVNDKRLNQNTVGGLRTTYCVEGSVTFYRLDWN
jgi:hypothetical protein